MAVNPESLEERVAPTDNHLARSDYRQDRFARLTPSGIANKMRDELTRTRATILPYPDRLDLTDLTQIPPHNEEAIVKRAAESPSPEKQLYFEELNARNPGIEASYGPDYPLKSRRHHYIVVGTNGGREITPIITPPDPLYAPEPFTEVRAKVKTDTPRIPYHLRSVLVFSPNTSSVADRAIEAEKKLTGIRKANIAELGPLAQKLSDLEHLFCSIVIGKMKTGQEAASALEIQQELWTGDEKAVKNFNVTVRRIRRKIQDQIVVQRKSAHPRSPIESVSFKLATSVAESHAEQKRTHTQVLVDE